jgi:hypothetical protein
MDSDQNWYLMKNDDGSVFGPVSFEQLRIWASEAQISPLDKVSNDEKTWVKAPMIPELEMDYLIEVEEDQYYGPTTIGAVREFVMLNEIGWETLITNCRDGTTQRACDFPELQIGAEEEQPIRISIRQSLQQRVRELEEALLEERRALEAAEQVIQQLEARLAALGEGQAIEE